jgi:hypothetical protein
MVEYADNEGLKIIKETIKTDLAALGVDFKSIKFHSPYSLFLRIIENLNGFDNVSDNVSDAGAESGGRAEGCMGALYEFGEESYALCFKSGRLTDIVNAGPFKKTDADPLKDCGGLINLTNLIRDSKKSNGFNNLNPDLNFLLENPQYIDLYFAAVLKKKDFSGFFARNESSKKFGAALLAEKASIVKITAAVISILLIVLLYNAENYALKLREKNALSQKINSVLTHYMPQKKLFYEPKREIRRYYRKLKEKTDLGGSGSSLLNFMDSISNAKARNSFKGLKADRVYYALHSFSFSGRINGYSKLNAFEKYLKQKYNGVTVTKSDKNADGTVSFRLSVKP